MVLVNPYYVYILTNHAHTRFYVGSTANLEKQIARHRQQAAGSFSPAVNCTKLVFFERHDYVHFALYQERNFRHAPRDELRNMVMARNPDWLDLSMELAALEE